MAAIQVISKTNWTTQHLVPVPAPPSSSSSSSTIPPSTIRIRPTLLSLTTNNLSYAKIGGLGLPGLAYWDVWRIPPSVAPPYNDESLYCRVSGWGFASVVGSSVPDLPVGSEIWGYLPLGAHVEELTVEKVRDGKTGVVLEGHWDVVLPAGGGGRNGLVGLYNRYLRVDAGKSGDGEKKRESRGWDSLMKVLFESGYLMDGVPFRGGVAGESVVHPSGDVNGEWSVEEGSLGGATVVVVGASGKTAVSFAYCLKGRDGVAAEKPARVVAVGSARSRDFTVSTGLFDSVLDYGDAGDKEAVAEMVDGSKKVILFGFDPRTDALERWVDALRPACEKLQVILVAPPGNGAGGISYGLIGLASDPKSGVVVADAGGSREAAIAAVGADKYFADFERAWAKFKADGAILGVRFVWRQGMESLVQGWEEMVKGAHGPETGLLFEFVYSG